MPKELKIPFHISWVTGTLAAESLNKNIISKLNTIINLRIDLIPIINKFYGENITVSGLLTGQDIFEQLKDRKLGNIVFLPPKVLNVEGLFLDNWNVSMLEEKLDTKFYVYKDDIIEIVDIVNNIRKES